MKIINDKPSEDSFLNYSVTARLAIMEIEARTELAYQSTGLDNFPLWEINYENGLEFYSYLLMQDDLPSNAKNVFFELMKLTEFNTYFAVGFDTASKAYEFSSDNNLENFADYQLDLVGKNEAKFEKIIGEMAMRLLPHVEALKGITNYSDLLALNCNVLEHLINFETVLVENYESDHDNCDGFTSGHHRDELDIFQSALAKVDMPNGCYVFMDDDGALHFDIHSQVLKYISKPETLALEV